MIIRKAKLYSKELILPDAEMKFFDGFIIIDNHMHLREEGRLLEAVRRFTKLGGNAINLVNLPDYSVPAAGYYEKIYGRTLRIADKVRNELKIPVIVTLGPYPLDFFHFQKNSIDGLEAMRTGLFLAEKLIKESKANAIGEIGRPHFEYSPDRSDEFNSMLAEAFKICASNGVPAILHTEDLSKEAYDKLEEAAKSSRMDPARVVKHHALASDINYKNSITLSLLATRQNTRDIRECKRRLFLETDYVDDPSSWKVIPPESVPKRAIFIRESMENWQELFSNLFRDTPIKVYGEESFRQLI